jgi:hypothetical protein
MKALRIPLAAVLTVCGLVLLAPAPPAAACSCAAGNPAAYVDWADAIFVGTLTGPPTDEAEGPVIGSGDPVVYTFDVETVLEGAVGTTAEVESARHGASCGLEGLEVGARYVMFAQTGRRPEALSANLCGGSQLAKANLIRRVEALTGSGETPAANPTAAVTDDDVGPPPGNRTVGYVLVGFAAVVLVGVGWVLVPRRRRTVVDRA